MTASDAASNTCKKAANLSALNGTQPVSLPWDKDTLGELLDRRVCAILALTDRGMAEAFMQKLAAQLPQYAQTAAAMKEKTVRRGRKFND
ncbi:MAG: hypothetical protein J5827_04900 [Oscillospiraceae bacterium]|nr:hypothetical protein [Oscillospiraceae bacterium]